MSNVSSTAIMLSKLCQDMLDWGRRDKKPKTNPNDNLTYGLFVSCFARSTQIGLNVAPKSTQDEIQNYCSAQQQSRVPAGVEKTVTLWFPLTETRLSWLVLRERRSRATCSHVKSLSKCVNVNASLPQRHYCMDVGQGEEGWGRIAWVY